MDFRSTPHGGNWVRERAEGVHGFPLATNDSMENEFVMSRMPRTSRNHSLILAAALFVALVPALPAAEEPPAVEAPPLRGMRAVPTLTTPPDEELDEVVVRGENLLKAIADAEDAFYDLFNEVNKDDDYDTDCVYLNTDPDNPTSAIKSRVCMPGFMKDAMADWIPFQARCQPPQQGSDEFSCLDKSRDRRLSMNEVSVRPEIEVEFATLDENQDSYIDRNEFENRSFSAGAEYQPPPPQLVLMERSKRWAIEMMMVVNSDPRLKAQAGHLDDLYRELRQVQAKYTKIKVDDMPEKTTRRELGPRSR
jgi:hypothetical protein